MPNVPVFGTRDLAVVYTDRPGAYALIYNDDHHVALIETSFGVFLPGGGLDPGEDIVDGLERELFEEMGAEVHRALFLGRADQYLFSRHYQTHFRKIGHFFRVDLKPGRLSMEAGHALLWRTPPEAQSLVAEEFYRWALSSFPPVKP